MGAEAAGGIASHGLEYVVLLFSLFVIPRFLLRWRVPTAVTSLLLGVAAGPGLGLFLGDPTVELLSTLGIVALFLLAGLHVETKELRSEARVLAGHLGVQVVLLAGTAVVVASALRVEGRPAVLFALALLTPSAGFILDSLGGLALDERHRFWIRSKAIATELLALAVLFFVVQTESPARFGVSLGVLLALVGVVPLVFRLFASAVLPWAPRSEFAFLVMVAAVSAFVTRELGVYYLVGAFVVGVTAQRFRERLPSMTSEKMLHAVESFGSLFAPFYFFHAGSELRGSAFSPMSLVAGLLFLSVAIPLRVAAVSVHRRMVLGESLRDRMRVSVPLIPTLVFTLVLAGILRDRYQLPGFLEGGLVLYALANTVIPGFFFHLPPPEFTVVTASPMADPAVAPPVQAGGPEAAPPGVSAPPPAPLPPPALRADGASGPRGPSLLHPIAMAAARRGPALVVVVASLALLGATGLLADAGAPPGGAVDLAFAVVRLLAVAGVIAGTCAAVWTDARASIVQPFRAAQRHRDRLRRTPVRAVGRLLLLGLLAATLAGALSMPYEYLIRLAGGGAGAPPPPEGAASLVSWVARGFPTEALATYFSVFWILRILADSRPGRIAEGYRRFSRRRPAAAAIASYGFLACLGALLLSHPLCQRDVLAVHPLWALFTAVSALTTTGLAPVDILTQWNWIGQSVVLALILAGGLGIFLFWGMISAAARRLHSSGLGTPDMEAATALAAYFRRTVAFFFGAVAAGALLLVLLDPASQGAGDRIFSSLFHSASAFCNAGFTLRGTEGGIGSLPYAGVMSLLVILGGLGPVVAFYPRSRHARVALWMSLFLVAAGCLLLVLFQRGDAGSSWTLALLQSVSSRTAGFGWIHPERFADATAFLLMGLMLVGAAPGGTGGGVKVTVFYTATRAFRAIGKSLDLPPPEFRRDAVESMEAFVVLLFFAALVAGGFLGIAALEDVPGIRVLFEVVSAVSTTGLSMGLTPLLSAPSLLILMVLMLAGKVGPFLVLLTVFSGRLDADDFLDRIREDRVLTA